MLTGYMEGRVGSRIGSKCGSTVTNSLTSPPNSDSDSGSAGSNKGNRYAVLQDNEEEEVSDATTDILPIEEIPESIQEGAVLVQPDSNETPDDNRTNQRAVPRRVPLSQHDIEEVPYSRREDQPRVYPYIDGA